MTTNDVPSRDARGNLAVDPEVGSGYRRFGGRTVQEALPLFIENPIERAAELQFAPAAVFNYYIFCFVRHLLTAESRGACDMASRFLGLVRDRVAKEPGQLRAVWQELRHALVAVSDRQDFYEADPSIYGAFREIRKGIEAAYDRDDHGPRD